MDRPDVLEALEVERYSSQWALREEERRRLLLTLEEAERVDGEKSA